MKKKMCLRHYGDLYYPSMRLAMDIKIAIVIASGYVQKVCLFERDY